VIERLHQVKILALDKTGTITVGKPKVLEMVLSKESSEEKLISYAASAEKGSQHPIAKAILLLAEERNIELKESSSFQSTAGKGMKCSVGKETVIVGNESFLKENQVKIPQEMEEAIQGIYHRERTLVFVAVDGQFVGALGLSDQPKEGAKDVIESLHKMGIEVWMLSGDSRKNAVSIGEAVGIPAERVIAGVLPQEKAQKIAEWKTSGRMVGMVGDGINDSPALAMSDVSLAVGSGSDIAVEAANVVLVNSSLRTLLLALKISKVQQRTKERMNAN
jgi:Cu+-exporting ATPase